MRKSEALTWLARKIDERAMMIVEFECENEYDDCDDEYLRRWRASEKEAED